MRLSCSLLPVYESCSRWQPCLVFASVHCYRWLSSFVWIHRMPSRRLRAFWMRTCSKRAEVCKCVDPFSHSWNVQSLRHCIAKCAIAALLMLSLIPPERHRYGRAHAWTLWIAWTMDVNYLNYRNAVPCAGTSTVVGTVAKISVDRIISAPILGNSIHKQYCWPRAAEHPHHFRF